MLALLLIGCNGQKFENGPAGAVMSDTVFGNGIREGYEGNVILSDSDKRVGYIFSKKSLDSSMGGVCTGTLVGPKHVLTAAHCLYDLQNSRWHVDFDFYPGINSEKMLRTSIRKYSWKRVFILKNYKKMEMTDGKTLRPEGVRVDIGLIELDEEIDGGSYGYFDFGHFEQLKYQSVIETTVVGYPGDKLDGTMWKSTCSDGSYSDKNRVINMSCDTYSGSSGSALRTDIGDQKDIIYAVNSSENSAENWAAFITSDINKTIKGWTDGTYETDELVKGMTSFIEKETVEDIAYSIELSNMCDKEMTLYLIYEDIKKGWETIFWNNLSAYSEIESLQTTNPTYYYYAKSIDGEYLLEGDGEHIFHVGSRSSKSFIKVEKPNDSFGKWRTSISCE